MRRKDNCGGKKRTSGAYRRGNPEGAGTVRRPVDLETSAGPFDFKRETLLPR